MTIYMITNLVNDKKYIGQTRQRLEKRLAFHFSPNNSCSAIGKAIQKYGKENFSVQVLSENVESDWITTLESYFIRNFRTLAPNGYNLIQARDVANYSEETRAKMSASAKKALECPILKAKNSAIRTGKPAVNRKPVYCIETGEVFPSATHAGTSIGVSQSTMSLHLSNKRQTVKNLTFKLLKVA